jgi:hypothetical protein
MENMGGSKHSACREKAKIKERNNSFKPRKSMNGMMDSKEKELRNYTRSKTTSLHQE